MRLVMFAVLTAGLIASCATAKLGMTLADFASACRSAHIHGATGIPLSTGDLVVMCPIAGAGIPAYPQYQLFEEGVLKQLLPKDEVMALLEHDRCVSSGAEPGSETYANCRSYVAQLREKHRKWYDWQISSEYSGVTSPQENNSVVYLYRVSPGDAPEPLVTEGVSVTVNNNPAGDLKYNGYVRVELEPGEYTVGAIPEPLRANSLFSRKRNADKPIDIVPLDLEVRPDSISFVSVSAEWEEERHSDGVGCAIGILEGGLWSQACGGSVTYERLLVEFTQTSQDQALAELTGLREAKASRVLDAYKLEANYERYIEAVPEGAAAIDLDVSSLPESSYEVLGTAKGVSCNGDVREEYARRYLAVNAAQLGGNAMIGVSCKRSKGIDWRHNCFDSIVCRAEAIKVDGALLETLN